MELETVCRYGLPIKLVILNNGGIAGGIEALPQDGPIPPSVLTPGAHYEQMMEAFGGKGFYVEDPADLRGALDAAMAFDGPALQPADPKGRARMTQICSLLDCYAYGPAIGKIVIERLVSPMLNREPDEATIAAAVPEAEKAYGVLEAFLGNRLFLVGDALSLADLHLAPNYAYFLMTPEGEGVMGGTPNLRRWWDNIKGRNAMGRTRPEFNAAG